MTGPLPPLERVTVRIPPEIAEFMKEVWERIVWHDETVEKKSDDSIQDPRIAPIIGGVIDAKAKYYSFQYTASKAPHICWHLTLFDNEIEDIAKGRVTSLNLWRCANACCRDLFSNRADVYCDCSHGFARRSSAENGAANNSEARINSQQSQGPASQRSP